jgi:hypothetical protein
MQNIPNNAFVIITVLGIFTTVSIIPHTAAAQATGNLYPDSRMEMIWFKSTNAPSLPA